jgi:regulator of sigma E protease
VLLFGAIILIHEFGHFIAARKCGIFVEEFAIGMGPKLYGRVSGKGTLYSVRLLPFGGFCKMRGEDESSDDPGAFTSKPVWKRVIVILAGVAMNFALSFAVMVFISAASGYQTASVSELSAGYPAEAAGIRPGDTILSVGGRQVHIFYDIKFALSEADGQPITVVVRRGGERLTTRLAPKLTEDGYLLGVKTTVYSGFLNAREGVSAAPALGHLGNAFYTNVFYVKTALHGLGQLITLKIGVDALSGPVGVTSALSDAYTEAVQYGFVSVLIDMLSFLAFLSANVGVFNLLPLPALDGGRFVFLVIEGIFRKPVKREVEGMIHFAGFALLMILTVFILYSDIMKLATGG